VKSEDPSLLARLDRFLGPRYFPFVAVLALALALLLGLAAHAQGGSGQPVRSRLWMLALDPVILVYILLVHPFMQRRSQRAMQSLEALAPPAGGTARAKPASRRGEWAALLAGALVGLAVARGLPGVEGWLRLYAEATSALMFFGGISLSLLFQSYASLRSLEGVIVYGTLVVVALRLFFMSMWTIHVALPRRRPRSSPRCGATWPRRARRCCASAGAPLGVYLLKLAFGVGGGL
jgi:hypothetical protein